jgi:hypothetical protein
VIKEVVGVFVLRFRAPLQWVLHAWTEHGTGLGTSGYGARSGNDESERYDIKLPVATWWCLQCLWS